MPEIPENEKQLLASLGFKPEVGQPKLYNNQVDENTVASVDYRKVNGRRFARYKGNFVDDPDSIEVLRKFKEEKDKLQSSKIPDDLETKDSSVGEGSISKTLSTPTIPPLPPANQINLYDFFYSLVGAGGIVEIFGDTGSLKTQLCVETIKDAQKLGKKVFYLDTEGKVGLKNKKDLGDIYSYIPVWEDIVKKIQNLPEVDFIVVDSVGFPILTEYAAMKANEQGDALLDLVAMVGKYLKTWAFKNNALVLITNQPKSEFLKSKEELNRMNPFGDKMHFAVNLILRANKTIIPGHYDKEQRKSFPPISVGTFTSHRSPDFMDDVIILSLFKDDDNVRIEIPKHVAMRLQKINEKEIK